MCIPLLSLSIFANAHQPDISSTILSEQENTKWILQVRSALTAFEYEIKTHFGDSSFSTPEEFGELVISHMQRNISIISNGDIQAQLTNGKIKLGHETNVVFEVKNIPTNIKSFDITNSGFKDISRNQSALIVVKKGFEKQQFILNNNNDHSVNLIVDNSKFVEGKKQELNNYTIPIICALALLFSVIMLFVIYRRTQP